MKNIKELRTELNELSETTDDTEMRKLTTLVRSGLFDAKKLTLLKRALNKDNVKMTKAERDTLLELLDKVLNLITTNQSVFQKVKQSVNEEVMVEDYEFSMARSQLKTIIRDAQALLDQIQGEGEMESWMQSKITLASDYIGAVADNVVSGESEIKKLKEEYEEITLDEAALRQDIDINQMPPIIILKRRAIRVYPDGQKVALYWADGIKKYVTVPFSSTNISINESTQADIDAAHQEYLNHRNLAGHHEASGDEGQAEIHARNADDALKRYKNLAGRDAALRLRALGRKVEKASTQRKLNLGKGVVSDYVKHTSNMNPVARIAGTLGVALHRRMKGTGPTSVKNLKLKEDVRAKFSSNLQNLREEQIDEFAPLLAMAARAAPTLARVGSAATKGASKTAKRSSASIRRLLASLNKMKNAKTGKDSTSDLNKDISRPAQQQVFQSARQSGGNPYEYDRQRQYQQGFGNTLKTMDALSSLSRTSSGFADTPVGQRKYMNAMMGNVQENTLNQLKSIVENNIDSQELKIGEEYITINNGMAKKILHIYESVNKINKVKMDRMLNESVDSFTKLLEFANRR